MSAETDVALMVELEEKIDQRIRDAIYKVGYNSPPTATTDIYTAQHAIANAAKINILNDNQFIAELTKRIGQRMYSTY